MVASRRFTAVFTTALQFRLAGTLAFFGKFDSS